MEDKIGEIVTLLPYDTKARVVEVEDSGCRGCYYYPRFTCSKYQDKGILGYCCYMDRKDCRNIIYKPLIREDEE